VNTNKNTIQEVDKSAVKVAYFSMEIALENDIKSYGGGLGVLAGDTLKSAADLRTPMVGVTLLNSRGYFKQVINENGEQVELPDEYDYSKLKKVEAETSVQINEDEVKIRAWEYNIVGYNGYTVPVYFLDTDVEGNDEKYRNLTGKLYGGGLEYRLMQEIILGRGGVKLLPILGYDSVQKHHLNEGHAALATIELFLRHKEELDDFSESRIEELVEKIRKKCVFTVHTPVKAGHDVFPLDLVKRLQPDFPEYLSYLTKNKELNMSHLATYFSSYINGVARSHQEISVEMFPDHEIRAVTNGVHSQTWTSPEFQGLFDKYVPSWRSSSLSLRNIFNVSNEEIWNAHQEAKKRLISYIEEKKGVKLSEGVFTIGFARRFTGYKRSTLLFYDIKELLRIHKDVGKIQIIYAGKAHPNDHNGKEMIKEVHRIIKEFSSEIKIIFLENYDMDVAKVMIPGVDVWLNTPLPPNEASGTSGMKAAHNGVPHFSTLDGWWLEGYIYKKTGWSIGEKRSTTDPEKLVEKDAVALYSCLENKILPRYYNTPEKWKKTMRYTIAINASFFNSERMLRQYAQEAYL